MAKENNLKAKRKIFPGLGGIKKNYLRKGKILKNMLKMLSLVLNKFIERTNLKEMDKSFLNEIEKDISKISEYEKINKINFYYLCQELTKKYSI